MYVYSELATADLRTKILDFRGFDSSIIVVFKRWNSHVHGEFPGKSESTNLSRENLSGEIGRTIPELAKPRRKGISRNMGRFARDTSLLLC